MKTTIVLILALVIVFNIIILVFYVPKHKYNDMIKMNTILLEQNDSLIDMSEFLINKIKSFYLFSDTLLQVESGNDTTIVNASGAMGAPQFMKNTLSYLGYDIHPDSFLLDPSLFPGQLQYELFIRLLDSNHVYFMKNNVYDYIGYQIDSIKITKSGLLAAAHLGGAYGTKKFLTTHGSYNPSDGRKRISDYLYQFSNYNF